MNHEDQIGLVAPQLVENARLAVKEMLQSGNDASPKRVLGRYAAAIAPNFSPWIALTYPWVNHEKAQYALKDNLRCELVEDHVSMLEDFAYLQSHCIVDEIDICHVIDPLRQIRKIFRVPERAGVNGLLLLAVLETASLEFIPVLEECGRRRGVKDFTYTQKHGEADIAHSQAFVEAFTAEWRVNTRFVEAELQSQVINPTLKLLRAIFKQ